MGEGSYGTVYKIKHRTSKNYYALKHISGIFDHANKAKNTLREIEIMIQLSQMKTNVFTVKLYDIIIPSNLEEFNSIFLVMEYWERDLIGLL